MLGEVEAVVVEIRELDIHGVRYVDVSIAYRDRSVEQARLGAESVPENLQAGDAVLATKAANMIIALRRP